MNLGNQTLDQMTCDILLYLYDEAVDQTASTSDLREALNVDRGRSIKYRIREYLQPRNLVEEEEQGTDEHGRDLPHLYRLTARGEQFVTTFREDLEPDETDDVEERLERLERRVDRMASALRSMKAGGTDD